MKKIARGKKIMFATIAGGIFVNILFAYIAVKFNFPLYMDVIGTIGVAFVAGALPALLVAVFTNLFCGLFNVMAVYYTIIGMYLAIISALDFISTSRPQPWGLVSIQRSFDVHQHDCHSAF